MVTANPSTARLADAAPLPQAVLDHVAVAVDDLASAFAWWRELGATPIAGWVSEQFSTEQVRLSNGGKIELLSHGRDDGFIGPFLQKYGSGRIHHITLKVPRPLQDAVEQLHAAGLDVVDISTEHADWHEAFLRPSQVGGLIVQVASSPNDDTTFAVKQGRGVPPPPDPTAPPLRRVVLGHPDLDGAAALWSLLGATVRRGEHHLVASWTDSPVEVEVRDLEHEEDRPGPIGLVLDGATGEPTAASPALVAASSELLRDDAPDRGRGR